MSREQFLSWVAYGVSYGRDFLSGEKIISGESGGIRFNREETILERVFECFVFFSEEWVSEGGRGARFEEGEAEETVAAVVLEVEVVEMAWKSSR
jgi:hypothetical protein